ncbi:acyl-CoA thioesterase [Wenzhouxiangella marina]|uniref:YbgC/YbaW family acyl-CoA thioester hydrolase n=1 Tax=Wenzhouxiangella marina TaxID=1579979 RepID=A0A0K0XXM9_9GAMM|nr:thioesterase family protein [Wenzhouxiangella marina]AKS42366.1 YbgC/YbaW family acyl-CoA thioester hydrolase [Wenzhouxiangella marina]
MARKFRTSLDIRWGDLDAFNHVSNVAYLRYIEECRAQWMDSVPSHWQGPETGPVVANININYRQAIVWPARIEVSLKPLSPGRSSIKLEHEIRALDAEGRVGELYADATSTLVWIDKKSGESVPLPVSIRELAAAED